MNAVPSSTTRVIIDGNVKISSRSQALYVGVYPNGVLSFDPNVNTKLSTGDLIVFPEGELIIGTESTPIAANMTAEVEIRDLPFADDPNQHLRTLLAVDGAVRIQGRQISEPFLKATKDIPANSTVVNLQQSAITAGWVVGDKLLIPKSSQCPIASSDTCRSETEERTISRISEDGLSITLSSPLAYQHPGARDADGTLRFVPYVLNVQRNVIIHSENANGNRGHIMLHGRADVMIRYAMIKDMGRTTIDNLGDKNQKGRYPLHAHHLIGPETPQSNGRQFTFEGNVIDFGGENYKQNRKWGLTIHDSHYGLIKGNIVDHASGAAIVTEDGSESFNQFYGNFAVRVVGGNGEQFQDQDPSDGSKLGRAGVGYWFNGGGLNSIRNNVAADIAECIYCYGFKFDNVYNDILSVPKRQGDEPWRRGQTLLNPYEIPITDFVGNESYATPNGLTIWWICAEFERPYDGCASTIKNFSVWHFHRWGYFGYETNQLTIDGFVVRGDSQILTNEFENPTGLWFGDYMQRRLTIQNADIQGVRTGIILPSNRDIRRSRRKESGTSVVRNSKIQADTSIHILPPASVNGSEDLATQRTIIRNLNFSHRSIQTYADISTSKTTFEGGGIPNLELRNDILLCNYQIKDKNSNENLYILPDYQKEAECDSTIANCSSNIAQKFSGLSAGSVYQAKTGCAQSE